MTDSLRFNEGDIVQAANRVWRIDKKTVVVTLDLIELSSEAVEPISHQVFGSPDDPAFNFITRLTPEGDA